jgi:hypothetical protein
MSTSDNTNNSPNGNIIDVDEQTQGLTNDSKNFGRRNDVSLNRHFAKPAGLTSAEISRNFWNKFVATTKQAYKQAPDLSSAAQTQCKHPMVPNLKPPDVGDDLSRGPLDLAEHVMNINPCVNWPLIGATATSDGPVPSQNPSYSSFDVTRANWIFINSRKDRYNE